ncbi:MULTISPECIES: DUF1109 domain-containing protein [unclassified Cupriavidus]|uniref:DUF1109 domain-containing protein n=1 Tax=unclassified Cupriavidus TaxID=2640874 RepID=UPI001C008446|nr:MULTISPECIES: DUF1109 domain-containing protein [unclassified Cupriavidus]MCA3186096.1 DUF1109 domain-containing protein [Cupriavidus sp.]MCA3189060.1 DUF1109 domain-containing protein [Cupriavidus sp.]MCA3198779.1 DUF1109 domain-containing protein [Cupriavidus sp.]MCA3201525.1 DUF1109 domain-containing protein [Cupriavidus sp.]MCA3209919.1 DUF1109 domain-containing protein [Cupriavidus sp.]
MKTDDLISMLATGVTPVDRHLVSRRFGIAIAAGAASAVLLLAATLHFRADLAEVAATPLFWAKVALPLSLLLGALWMLTRLARPGMATGPGWPGISAPFAAVWIGTAYVLARTPAGERVAAVLGQTWRVCPFAIAMLSAPVFIAVFWALRGLAPTRLRLTGAVGGLLSGAVATLVYCLHCPEMGVAFWGVWYVLGMLVPAAIGALVGPRLLRW